MNLLYVVKYVKHVDSAYALAGRGGVTCQVCARVQFDCGVFPQITDKSPSPMAQSLVTGKHP